MENKDYFLDNLNKSAKIRIDLNTRDPQEIAEVVAFFEANRERYGRIDADLSKYGCLYLKTTSREQRRAFIEDVFAQTPPLTRIVNMAYEVARRHVPEPEEGMRHRPQPEY